MVEFLDGPAAGESLPLRRAPLYLRVVLSSRGNWDALDQLGDTPNVRETIFAYRRVGEARWMHMKFGGRGAKAASGYYAMAKYEVAGEQPDDATMRDAAKWRAWCVEQQKKEKGRTDGPQASQGEQTGGPRAGEVEVP